MKVLHVITTMDRGGAENHVATLSRAQIAHGHEARIVYLKGSGEALPARVPSRRISPIDVRKRANIANWLGSDGIVHAHLPRAELIATTLLRGTSPLIITRHNTEPFLDRLSPAASSWLGRTAAKPADTVIAISQAVRDYHTSSGHLSPAARVEVIPYGIAAKNASPKFGPRLEFLGGLERPLKVACVARLVPQKDLSTLLRATRVLLDRGQGVEVRIAGEGSERHDLERLIDELGLQRSVTLVGRISGSEDFIAAADIFVLPSRYEGLGLVLLEAMSVETPVVAARNTAIAEVVVDGTTGLLFETGNPADLADKLQVLAANPSLRQRLAHEGALRLQTDFSVDRMVAQTMAVYEGALERVR